MLSHSAVCHPELIVLLASRVLYGLHEQRMRFAKKVWFVMLELVLHPHKAYQGVSANQLAKQYTALGKDGTETRLLEDLLAQLRHKNCAPSASKAIVALIGVHLKEVGGVLIATKQLPLFRWAETIQNALSEEEIFSNAIYFLLPRLFESLGFDVFNEFCNLYAVKREHCTITSIGQHENMQQVLACLKIGKAVGFVVDCKGKQILFIVDNSAYKIK